LNGGITPVVRKLLFANVIVFVAQLFVGDTFTAFFGLTRGALLSGYLWQLFTYMFLHSPFLLRHLIFNMMGLFFLGPEVERGMGGKHFLTMYLLSGVLGGVGWVLLSGDGLCVGASGALMGVFASFAVLYPKQRLSLIFLPMFTFNAWVLVLGFTLIELFLYLGRPDSTVAHTVHLAGGVAGCFYTLAVFRPNVLRMGWMSKRSGRVRTRSTAGNGSTMTTAELDGILEKISKDGMQSLTRHERALLNRASEQRRNRG
jgi:membrane associated rhomboid family serine protease